MAVKLTSKRTHIVNVLEMRDGQIAEIVEWRVHEHIGIIVQRYGEHLMELGKGQGDSFSNVFLSSGDWSDFKVRILQNGETLTIEGND
jgi:hypothetical protein